MELERSGATLGVTGLPGAAVSALPTIRDLEACIRCGLCLSVCPTYRLTGAEGDSPRGRIALVKAQIEGKTDSRERAFARHMDRCLQCMACFTVCPMDVSAGETVSQQKSYSRESHRRSLSQWLLRTLVLRGAFPSHGRLEAAAVLLRLYTRSGLQRLVRTGPKGQRLPGLAGRMESLLPRRVGRPARARIPEVTAARGEARSRVAYHLCCMNNILFPDACAATVRVLARNGAEVVMPKNSTCCGAPHETTGEMALALKLARRNIAVYERLGVDRVITDAAACGAAMKQYKHWLRNDPAWAERAARFSAMVRDIHEFLVELGMVSPAGRVQARVTYDDPCHLRHAQGISVQPRAILAAIHGLDYVELPEAGWCCGSAGIYNLVQPGLADAILKDKMEHIRGVGADVIATANPGCMLQIEAGLRRHHVRGRVRHVMELLDEAYGGAGDD